MVAWLYDVFFFNDTATTEIYTLSLHDALPICQGYYFNQGKFELNIQKAIEDSGVLRFDHTPWIGLISDDSTSIPRITLIDVTAWDFLRSEMLYTQYLAHINMSKNPVLFSAAKKLLKQIPMQLSEKVHGNHL